MSNSIFLTDNFLDTATIAASSEAIPVQNITNPQRSRVWRSGAGVTSHIDITLDDPRDVTHAAFVDVNLSSGSSIRLEAWLTGLGAGAPVVTIDTEPTLFGVDYPDSLYGIGPYGVGRYGTNVPPGGASTERNITIVEIPDAAKNCPYWRITFTDYATAYQQTSKIFLGAGLRFAANLSYGWQAQYVERSVTRESAGGQLYTQRRPSRLQIGGSFGYLSDDERTTALMALRQLGESEPIIYSVYPESTDQGATTSVYGRLKGPQISGKNFNINELTFSVIEDL